MHDKRGAMINWTAEVRRRCRVIDNQRDAGSVSDIGDFAKVRNVASGIGDGLAENGACIVVDCRLHRGEVVEINKLGRPAETFDRVSELRDRSAVQPAGCDDIASRSHQWEQRHDLGCMA